MKWAREIERFVKRQREKFQASGVRRWPDRNICCKCGYDLSGIAAAPPAPSEPDLLCPECGKPVSLRDHWWTDGRCSMKSLTTTCVLLVCVLLCFLAVTAILLNGASDAASRASVLSVAVVGGGVIYNVLLVASCVVACIFGSKGSAIRWHGQRRIVILLIPFVLATVIVSAIKSFAPWLLGL